MGEHDIPLSLGPTGVAAAVYGNGYRYTDDLLALEAASSGGHVQELDTIPASTLSAWDPFLSSHPDQRFAAYLRRGLAGGFRIGFRRSSPLRAARGNMGSVHTHPVVISDYIQGEVSAGRMRSVENSFVVHKSPIGIIPKPHQPGKFRLIVDLSAPEGASVNDGVDPSLCSLSYASVEKAVELVRRNGRGCMMAKLDLMSAYRQVPVHPSDHPLLCVEWRGVTYADQALPFGLRSAPKIFTAVADGLSWAMICLGLGDFLHYLDDFFFCGSYSASECAGVLREAVSVCERLGFPIAPSKIEGPATSITFLGIEIDSVAEESRLPAEKLHRLRISLSEWSQRRTATKRDLQSLIGQLNHAASVVRPGRAFTRQLIETMKIPKKPFQRVRLNAHCKADIAWWSCFVASWNGVSMFPSERPGPTVVSDASGSWGCGAFCPESGNWFQIQWPPCWQSLHIAAKELLPVVVSAALWGRSWAGSTVLFRSDNQAVVSVLDSRSARDPHLAHLLRNLFFIEARHQFGVRARHIPGKDNVVVDALSRGNLPLFFSLCPQAPATPSAISPL